MSTNTDALAEVLKAGLNESESRFNGGMSFDNKRAFSYGALTVIAHMVLNGYITFAESEIITHDMAELAIKNV